MLCLTCTMISSVDLAYYGFSRAKDWISVNCGIINFNYLSCSTLTFFLFACLEFTSKAAGPRSAIGRAPDS